MPPMNTGFCDRYPDDLDHEADRGEVASADSGLYRRILTRMPVVGLPSRISIGAVSVNFTAGPVKTQRTKLRQRPGFPFVFDKHMHRGIEVGDGELLTVLEFPVDVREGFQIGTWRSVVDTAVGLLISTLDERVAGAQLGEDVILIRSGESVAAAEEVSRVRTFMPFEITDSDLAALTDLSSTNVQESSPGNTAAALLGAATREGPSRLGFLLMWLAVDAIVYKRGTKQAKALEAALGEAGFAETWLQLPVGRLASLRGKIAHGKPESDELIYMGYYDMEAVARVLIAKSCGQSAGWPASPTATAFLPRVARQLGPSAGKYEEIWHQGGLPAVDPSEALDDVPPVPARYDAVLDGHAAWLHIESGDASCDLRALRWALWQALVALDFEAGPLRVVVTDDHDYGPNSLLAVGQERILVSPSFPSAFSKNPDGALVLELCGAIAQQAVMRTGVPPDHPAGAFLIELVGAWAAQSAVPDQALDVPADLERADQSLPLLGHCIGLAIAGNELASRAVDQISQTCPDDILTLIQGTRDALAGVETLSDLLEHIRTIVEHVASESSVGE